MQYELVRPRPLTPLNMEKTRTAYRVVDEARLLTVVACALISVALALGALSGGWVWVLGHSPERAEAMMAEYGEAQR